MRTAIIGGGAAGLMATAALQQARPDMEVFLIESNPSLGKKVIISGGGRCNLTTGTRDVRELLKSYPRGGKFLTSAIYGFPPGEVYDWFVSHGVPLYTQADNRVFPRSDDGRDVVGVFERLFRKSEVRLMLDSSVSNIVKEKRGFVLSFGGKRDDLVVDQVILTTGGRAFRQTGSTGDGYGFAESLGHTLTPLAPSLNSFDTKEGWPAKVSGVSFPSAVISSPRDRKYSHTGPFLFTHRGISGPAVFALSSLVAFEDYGPKNPLPLEIDLFPNESLDGLTERINAACQQSPTRSFLNVISGLVPKSLAEICVSRTGAEPDRRAVETGKKQMAAAAGWLKAIPLQAVGRGAGDEFVTAGGIPHSEINPSTMESKVCPGLFFAGEIIDVDGFTGGFNLQASWATGRLAGLSAAKLK